MNRYRVNWTILAGDRKHAGEIIELPDELAETLLAGGSVSRIEPGAAPASSAPDDPAERAAAIEAAIDGLDAAAGAHFTADGRPHVAALEAALGWNITAAERDAAWAVRRQGEQDEE